MPLYPRAVRDRRHDTDPSPHAADQVIVLSGNLVVGGYHRVRSGPSEGNWTWATSLGSGSGFVDSGFARSADECKAHIGKAFRGMLARADLRERPDAKPGPPRRDAQPDAASPNTSWQLPAYDRDADRASVRWCATNGASACARAN